MSLYAVVAKCAICGTWYRWNPDVGQLACPKCGSMMKSRTEPAQLSHHGAFAKNGTMPFSRKNRLTAEVEKPVCNGNGERHRHCSWRTKLTSGDCG